MNHDQQAQALAASGAAIIALVAGVTPEQARWKPAPDKWSLLEILCHLCDEERDDFRRRLGLVLEDPGQNWPPIDPVGWARERDYNSRELEEMLVDFRQERAASLEWLRDLESPAWNNEFSHPKIGGIKAGDLLASWVAHDNLHLRQLANVQLACLNDTVSPYSTRYALP